MNDRNNFILMTSPNFCRMTSLSVIFMTSLAIILNFKRGVKAMNGKRSKMLAVALAELYPIGVDRKGHPQMNREDG